MLWLVLTRRSNWRYLTPFYLRMAVWWSLRIEVKKFAPRWFIQLYLRLAGYSKSPAPTKATPSD